MSSLARKQKICGMYPDLGFSENTGSETIIAGVAPVKIRGEAMEDAITSSRNAERLNIHG
ncbi:hypothetical protein SADUNF_Sadunf19G0101400 [Salix dunnii]|uniref:Metallothionein-like protein n=1 Tax=Salix dunnii TaxID=1413687 RepID=A0A835J4U1_9ROSI|nr:hypothetical protein SADUNF_Sadunf19G0101400 [Salix dunnii]